MLVGNSVERPSLVFKQYKSDVAPIQLKTLSLCLSKNIKILLSC